MNATTLRRCFPLATLIVLLAGMLSSSVAQQAKLDPTAQFVNQKLAEAWKAQKLTPAERASDEEFIRRASLDIIGRIATPDEVRAFLKDTSTDKRAKLVDRLLESKDYASNWAGTWTTWLVTRSGPGPVGRLQLFRRLNELFAKPTMSHKDMVAELISVSGKSNEKPAAHYLLAHLGQEIPANKRGDDGMFDMVPATSRSLRLFLGYRLIAYQLPDHPVHPDFKPEQFWGVNAFFRQVERIAGPTSAAVPVFELKDNPEFNKKGLVSYPDKDGTTKSVGAVFLDGRKLPADGKQTRREVLAGYITNHDNFTKAYVNRMWGHFFGRGLHERAVVDDFGTHHKAVHPELLDRLAKDFAAGGYDPKKLIRWICASDAYQLKSTSNATNGKEEVEVYFSRMPLKIMTPEQLLESLLASIQGDAAETQKLRGAGHEHIARRLGDADWDDMPAQERIIQNVVLINRKDVNDALLTSKTGPVGRAMALKEPEKILVEMYLIALNRQPTDKEKTQFKALVDKETKDGKDLTNLWQDLYWALLNSSEFILNH